MKKVIVVLFLVSLAFIFSNHDEEIIIPNNAIRFRVIANSDSVEDQMKKMEIKSAVENKVYALINGENNAIEVRNIIEDNMDTIKDIVEEYNVPYNINYGNNYFPSKTYKGVMYPAGNYESLVITLGDGVGANFWCVLFPPLCLIDNSKEDISDVDYQLYVKKLLKGF
ncbi:MAG TPA: stage II sporulation protein R [Candidatus Caccenecus avistercoris]|nr:stage II sporulation protein R [Candidatus Caccenecus avistercoris]